MDHLILGGTGTVGRAVVLGLLEKQENVRVLTRSEDRARTVPAGATTVIGDLTDPDTYGRIFTGFDTLFLLIGNTITEQFEGLAAVTEARRAGIERIVYLSAQYIERGPHIPHFAAKVTIEEAVRASGVPYSILRPNNFFQNDIWIRDAIAGYGVYSQPIGGVGLSRVDVRDVADAAVIALTEPGYDGRTYNLVGPDALTGNDCAAVYSEVLGQDVRYAGDDLEAFAAVIRPLFPAWLIWDALVMFELFQFTGMVASRQHLRETEEILGRQPRRFEAFAHELFSERAQLAVG